MVKPDTLVLETAKNQFIVDELSYDKNHKRVEHETMYPRSRDEQLQIYKKIMSIVV